MPVVALNSDQLCALLAQRFTHVAGSTSNAAAAAAASVIKSVNRFMAGSSLWVVPVFEFLTH